MYESRTYIFYVAYVDERLPNDIGSDVERASFWLFCLAEGGKDGDRPADLPHISPLTMHQTAEEKLNEPPRRRWGDGIRRRRLQRAQSALVGSPSPPISKQDTSASNASEGTDSLATLLEERSKELLLRRPDRISITCARKSRDERLGLCLRVVKTAGSTDGTTKTT